MQCLSCVLLDVYSFCFLLAPCICCLACVLLSSRNTWLVYVLLPSHKFCLRLSVRTAESIYCVFAAPGTVTYLLRPISRHTCCTQCRGTSATCGTVRHRGIRAVYDILRFTLCLYLFCIIRSAACSTSYLTCVLLSLLTVRSACY